MMAYKGDVVASILVNEKPLREQSVSGERTVRVPFGTEYKIRIQNKNNVRIKVEIFIDGTKIHDGKFILNAGEKLDLERFCLDGDMSKGRRLKFVESSNSEVQDPYSKDNGLVEIRFEKEVYINPTLTVSDFPFPGLISRGPSLSATNCGIATNTATKSVTNCSLNTSDSGATIEGRVSNQHFLQVNTDFDTYIPEFIQIRMKGPAQLEKTCSVKFENGVMSVRVAGNLVKCEEATITATHLVVKIPIAQVQIG